MDMRHYEERSGGEKASDNQMKFIKVVTVPSLLYGSELCAQSRGLTLMESSKTKFL